MFGKVTSESVVFLVHFAHLANTLLKDEESALDNHVAAVLTSWTENLVTFMTAKFDWESASSVKEF